MSPKNKSRTALIATAIMALVRDQQRSMPDASRFTVSWDELATQVREGLTPGAAITGEDCFALVRLYKFQVSKRLPASYVVDLVMLDHVVIKRSYTR